MYRNYCNERGCPGHVKNWENCRERRLFAASAGAPGPIREFIQRPAQIADSPARALATPAGRPKIG